MSSFTYDERGWLAGARPGAEPQHPMPVQHGLPFIEPLPANDDNAPLDPKIFVAK